MLEHSLKIKGTHTAMKSGMIASDLVFKELISDSRSDEISKLNESFMNSWAGQELKNAEM